MYVFVLLCLFSSLIWLFVTVPTRQTAFESLIEIHESGKNKNADAAAAELRQRAAQFIKTGIELDGDWYVLACRTTRLLATDHWS